MKLCKDAVAWEKIIRKSPNLICTIDHNGCFLSINEACLSILGYNPNEIIGCPIRDLLHPEDLSYTLAGIQKTIGSHESESFENRFIHKHGQEVILVWSVVWSEEEQVILSVGRDVTAQRLIQQKEQLHQSLVELGSDMMGLLDEQLNFLYSGASTLRELGYQPEQLVGVNAIDFIHPEDVPLVKESLQKILVSKDYIKVSDFRFKDAEGQWRWLEVRARNQLDNPAVRALVTNSRDITERVHTRLKLQESEQRFKSLFDHHLDMVLFQNKQGIIVDVNAAALSFFGAQKEDIVDRPFSDFLTPEVIPVCESAFQQALKGKWVRYETQIPFEGKGIYIFDLAKVPVVVHGVIIGVYTILRDITEISRSNHTVKQQAKKLNTIFESITDAFFTLDNNWNFTYVNSEFDRILRTEKDHLIGKNIWEVFPKEVNGEFYKRYHSAIENSKAVHFDAYFESLDIWLQVKAFPSEEGLSVYFDDVTEKVKSRQELEKLSLVASKTTNGVVITDAHGRIEWVNESFSSLTGYHFSEVVGSTPWSVLNGKETDKTVSAQLQESRSLGKHFHGELLVYKKSGEKIWLLLDITPVFNEVNEINRFITIQSDITERKETEVRQLKLTQDLYRQNRDLQQFSYIVSHNLRSPVARVMGLAELLSTVDKASGDFDVFLTHLTTSVESLDTVLQDLNTILSIPEHKNTIKEEKVQLVHVYQQAVVSVQETLNACGGEVIMHIEENVHVHGNKAYLHSIFYNLLSNAIKYRSPKRALKIRIKCLSKNDKGTLISFSDNGLGIDMNVVGDKIFTLYKRFHTHSEGRGIGLFLVKAHLEAMGGHIEVKSQVDVGTTFLISLQ